MAAGPGGVPTQVAFSQSARWPVWTPIVLKAASVLASTLLAARWFAVLTGNIALNGCVVKTAGVDDSLLVFEGTAHVTES